MIFRTLLLTATASLLLAAAGCEEDYGVDDEYNDTAAPTDPDYIDDEAERTGEAAEDYAAEQQSQFVDTATMQLENYQTNADEFEARLEFANEDQRVRLEGALARMRELIDQTEQAIDELADAEATQWTTMRERVTTNFNQLDEVQAEARDIVDEIGAGAGAGVGGGG